MNIQKKTFNTDYDQNDWCPGSDTPTHTSLSRLGPNSANIPMPTLYAIDGHRKPKLSIVELVLYNMASMLAGVASGYDVRMSNVSPVHPNLQPQLLGSDDVDDYRLPIDHELTVQADKLYGSNTYHGTVKHSR